MRVVDYRPESYERPGDPAEPDRLGVVLTHAFPVFVVAWDDGNVETVCMEPGASGYVRDPHIGLVPS